MFFLTVLALLSCNAALMHGHKILLLPFSFPSHARLFSILGDALVENGHEVYMGVSETFPPMDFLRIAKTKLIRHTAPHPDLFTMDQGKLGAIFQSFTIVNDMIKSWRENPPPFQDMCTNAVSDEDYFRTLAEMKFDLAIVDTFPNGRCLLLLPYDLDIPFVSVTSIYEPWLMRNPALPSFVPSNILSIGFTDKMSFFERLYNLWQNVDWVMAPRINFLDETYLTSHIRNKEKVSVNEIITKALLFFINDDIVIDYPKPVMPNEVHIGGISMEPAKPLSGDLKDFMDESEEGVIIMTFGATDFDLPEETVRDYLNAFSQVKYRFLWKYHRDVPFIPPNVQISKWLPQNDLLAHPNTKIFITHCGNGGQFEALFHGIPMIGLPVFADQPYNCKRMEAHGFGICLHSMHIKTPELVTTIQEIANNGTYTKNIHLASEIYKSNPQSAHEKFIFWINHVLKYGGKHLHSHALDMPWYQYLMLDLFAFVFLMVALIILAVGFVVSRLIKYQTSK